MAEVAFPKILNAKHLRSRADILARPSPVPQMGGVYAWYFRRPPPGVDLTGCHRLDDLWLLYVGISPKPPPADGRPGSRSTLRKRLQTHLRGKAAGSTLRKTLGCLLAAQTGFPLRRVGSGQRMTFTNPGEQALDAWLDENAFVAWHATPSPWLLERQILASGLPLPLNIRDNPCLDHVLTLSAVRAAATAAALALPVVSDNGGARRRGAIATSPTD
jgi:hypothetical protein